MNVPSVEQIEKDMSVDPNLNKLPLTAWCLPQWDPVFQVVTASDDKNSRRRAAELIREELKTCKELRAYFGKDDAVYTCAGEPNA